MARVARAGPHTGPEGNAGADAELVAARAPQEGDTIAAVASGGGVTRLSCPPAITTPSRAFSTERTAISL